MEDDQILVFDFYLQELEKILNYLNPSLGINDNLYEKRIGTFRFFQSIIKNLKFLRINYEKSPFTSFATLSRMIVDHYSAFFLISSHSSLDHQKLRYYLLMIGSLEGRIKTISDFQESMNNLPSEVIFDNQKAISHDENAVDIYLQKLESENLINIVEKKHIDKRNWKYPGEMPAKNENFYNWQELYKIAKIPGHFSKAIQQHFSEFTHGLGLTILYTEEKSDSKQSIIAILCIIQSLIGKIMINEYSIELKELNLSEQFTYDCNFNWNNWK